MLLTIKFISPRTALCITATILAIILSLPAQTIAQSSVTLTWTAPGDDGMTGAASYYDVRYSTSLITEANWDAASQASNEPTPQEAGNQESFTILGLQESSTYYIAIKVADEAMNWSALSNVVTRTTNSETISPDAIGNLAASNPSDTSVLLSWTAPGDDGSTGTASQYELRYSTSLITEGNWNSATLIGSVPAPQIAGSSESFLVTGLNQETTYYFAIKTADEVPNWSTLSNVTSTATVDLTPPAAVDDLAATSGAADGTIILDWTAPGDDGDIGRAVLYQIRYSSSEINESNWLSATLYLSPPPPLPADAGEQQTHTLTGLNPGQLYYAAIRAYDNNGNLAPISNAASAEAGINISTDIDDNDLTLPTEFTLNQNYPNPFNPSTTISFSLPENAYVNLSIYNMNGRKVTDLVSRQLSAGNHQVEWNGNDNNGTLVASGMYIYRIQTESFNTSKKMVLMK